jgi:hypothetical protein
LTVRLGRMRQERKLENDLAIVDLASVLETSRKVKLLRTTRAGHIGHDERGENGFASYVCDDVSEGRGAYALALKLGIDHQTPHPYLRFGRGRRTQRFVVEHHEPCKRVAEIDRAIPRFFAEESLGKRNRIVGDETLLIGADRKSRDLTHSRRGDLAERYLRLVRDRHASYAELTGQPPRTRARRTGVPGGCG